MRWLLSLFAVVGLAGALPLTVPSPAYACSCVFPADGSQIVEQVSHAASVFGGIVTGERVKVRPRSTSSKSVRCSAVPRNGFE